ncbi:transposase IS66 [Caballeronia udeis]|uniref:Transposase IS66 n=1 Tax=Caballeronia udeis TaxID=1232866 RepID=A0A158GRX3_9BURK|nr:transposase IS66 [Caballeronia udeis]
MYGQSPQLVRYIGNGNKPIINKRRENAIRPFVIAGADGCLPIETATAALWAIRQKFPLIFPRLEP